MGAAPAPAPIMEGQKVQSAGLVTAPAPAPAPIMEGQKVQSAGLVTDPAPALAPGTKGIKVQTPEIDMGTPVLSRRALQELMKRNHKNFVSIKVDEEVVFRVPRPLAVRFSAVWSRILQNITCTIVTVDFPLDPPAASDPRAAPLISQSGPDSRKGVASSSLVPPPPPLPSAAPLVPQSGAIAGKEPAPPNLVPPPPPPPSGKIALKFIVQWMEAGGAEPRGVQAVLYPRRYRPALEKILAIASKLEINDLVTRVKCDLGKLRAPRPKKCPTCKKFEHPGRECQSCFHCGDFFHRIKECPVREREFLEREARRARKAEAAKKREAAHKRWLEKDERRRAGEERRRIAAGELGVNDAGKTIPVRGPGKLTLGRTSSTP